MRDGNTMREEIECSRVLTSFATYLDQRRYDDLIALTTPDCCWSSKGVARGHAEIRERLAARPSNRTTLHLLTNLQVEIGDDMIARAHSCILVYRFDEDGQFPFQTTTPHTVARCEDLLTMALGHWLIMERRMSVIAQQSD
jgi:3-phenylpropionate/cinnamic acid dioxygenase small subunit